MQPKRQPSRGPRPSPAMKSGTRPSKYPWYHRPYHCYPWYDYDYDWYDYDWYDYDYDYDSTDWDFYSAPRRPKAQRPVRNWDEEGTMVDPVVVAYQQGFKDGWAAAMDYMMYGEKPSAPVPDVAPVPAPPETPAE